MPPQFLVCGFVHIGRAGGGWQLFSSPPAYAKATPPCSACSGVHSRCCGAFRSFRRTALPLPAGDRICGRQKRDADAALTAAVRQRLSAASLAAGMSTSAARFGFSFSRASSMTARSLASDFFRRDFLVARQRFSHQSGHELASVNVMLSERARVWVIEFQAASDFAIVKNGNRDQ